MATSGGSAPHRPQPNLELRRRAKDLKLLNPQHAPDLPDVLKKTQHQEKQLRFYRVDSILEGVDGILEGVAKIFARRRGGAFKRRRGW
eukprot:g19881.t1